MSGKNHKLIAWVIAWAMIITIIPNNAIASDDSVIPEVTAGFDSADQSESEIIENQDVNSEKMNSDLEDESPSEEINTEDTEVSSDGEESSASDDILQGTDEADNNEDGFDTDGNSDNENNKASELSSEENKMTVNSLMLMSNGSQNESNVEFEATASLMYGAYYKKPYVGILVETDGIPASATEYGVEIDGYKYFATSALVNGKFVVDVAALIAKTAYTGTVYYTENGKDVYADSEFSFRTPASMLSTNGYYYAEGNNVGYSYTDKGIDVKGKDGNGNWIQSTYSTDGWPMAYGNTTQVIHSSPAAKSVYGGDIHAWVVPEISDDGYFVKVKYFIRNVTNDEITYFQFGASADVQIGSKDNAPIRKTEYGLELSDDTNTFALLLNEGYTETPVTTKWFGHYSDAASNVYNNIDSESLSGKDSGAAYSWQNITLAPGEIKSYEVLLGVGDADTLESLIKPNAAINYVNETISGLTAGSVYIITVGGDEYTVTADANGEIAISGTDNNGEDYVLLGNDITIAETKEIGGVIQVSTPQDISVGTRPNAVIPDYQTPDDTAPELPDDLDITTTDSSITIKAEDAQEYSIDGGETWVTANGDGNVIFTGLNDGTVYNILTRVAATSSSFASESEDFDVKTSKMLTIIDVDISGETQTYDGSAKVLTIYSEGTTVSYSTTLAGLYSATFPECVDVGTYTVYYKLSKEGYHDYYNVANLEIKKGEVSLPVISNKTYTGNTLKADVSENEYYTVSENDGGITVGQYDVVLTLKDSKNYKWSDGTETARKTIKFEIKKATANVITGLAIEGWTYGESAKTPSASATFGTPAFTYVGTGETHYAESATPPANAGTYKVIAKVADTTNYAGASDEKTFSIAKATPNVSAPTAKTGLVYNGADKELVSAGTTSGGEMQYSLDNSTWTTEIPQGNSAGSYTVYYKVVGGTNYNDNAGGTVQVTIAKAQIAKPSADSRTFTYTGNEQTYNVTASDYYTVNGTTRTDAGSQNVTVALKDKNNYEWADGTTDDITFTFNIGKADAEITINGDTSIVKTYGDIWELTTASSTFGTVTKNKTEADLKNAGTYTVTYSVEETENYNGDTKTVSVTVNPLPVNITWENTESLAYDGNEKTITPVVANKVSGDTFNFVFDGTSTLTATEKGTYTVTVTDVGNTNYTLTGGTNLTKTWAIAEAANEWTTPLSITGWIYGGTANEPTAAAKFGTPVYTYANSVDGAYTSDVPTSAGTWYVKATVAGATSYAEISDTKEFVITEKELNADSITAIGDVTFTGEEIKPAVEVRDGNTILVLGTDYEVAYQDNTNAGTAKVIITFKGNYKGTPEKSFTILPKKINPSITLAAPVSNETPVTSIETDEYTATVVWSPAADDKFAYSTEYTATVTVTPKANYTVTGITENEYTIEGAIVTNTAESGNITAVFAKTGSRPSSGGGRSKYTVKFETNGGTTVANKSVTRNALLAEPTAPTKDGYTFDGWYTDKELTTAYNFDTKVTKGFTLYAKWTEIEKEPEDTDVHNCPSEAFTDLDTAAWYHLDTDYVIENGIFKGTTENIFEPNTAQTRAMMVTVLYRAEGEPAVNKSIPFADIDMGAYYANAVIWAQQNGIVKGVSETEFAPDNNITREQIAAIMHRYATFKGYDVSVGENTNILSYDDFDSISEYAIASIQWACGSGLIKGRTESTLNPKENATRAEIAAILHRFLEANK